MKTAAVVACVVSLGVLTGCAGAQGDLETHPSPEACSGTLDGGIRVANGGNYKLAKGAHVQLGGTNMRSTPPRASLSLDNVSESDRESAARLEAGDTFQVNGVTYRLNRICAMVVDVAEVS